MINGFSLLSREEPVLIDRLRFAFGEQTAASQFKLDLENGTTKTDLSQPAPDNGITEFKSHHSFRERNGCQKMVV